ncbi:acetyl-CoA synthetase [Methylobacterium radiotolerans]|uniref:Acetyl-coenzyme A synthetase n=2 Tax=Pseudomonadota TaxID=1224 RepID=A0ABV2NDR4_9HYPH
MEGKVIEVQSAWREGAHVDDAKYREMYAASVADPDAFWAEHGKRIDWMKPFSTVKNTSFEPGKVSIKWFEDGTTNVAHNCIDRHLETRGDQTAIIWEGDNPDEAKHISYRELHAQVCRMANVLRNRGVGKGDRVTLYMPMIPEAAYAMLACARLGAIHAIVFGGFSPDSLASRIQGCGSKVVITADEGLRGGRKVPLKANVDEAIKRLDADLVDHVIVVRRTGGSVAMEAGRDVYYDEAAEQVTDECPAVAVEAEHPLFILYTSGSTGQPKGVVHTTGGYLVYASMTHEYVFDYREGDVYWCTADVGWVTGHSYIVYGPLANGATTLMFEGIPTYPSTSRFWEVVDKHKVNIFYTAPTAIRSLMGGGEGPVKKTSRQSLRVLGSVGEPINPEAWEWYYNVVGDRRCSIVDTWWQTETGGILITPLPGATALKPGSATRPFFGVKPQMVDAEGKVLEGPCEGNLCIADSWPGQMRTVYGDHERFEQTYFSTYPGKYFTGDGARRDADGYYWITGRVDDVINVSGHRMGTAEVESSLVAHPKVAEAAVVGYPHNVKGQGIYAYVTLNDGEEGDDALRKELVTWVRKDIGPIASPDLIQFAPGLAQDPFGQDHAPDPAQDRRGRFQLARRYLDAGRAGRRRRPDREPAEPGLIASAPPRRRGSGPGRVPGRRPPPTRTTNPNAQNRGAASVPSREEHP